MSAIHGDCSCAICAERRSLDRAGCAGFLLLASPGLLILLDMLL